MANRKVPTVIALSAILKTGHILTSMKSITYPNISLSTRFPNAPERIKIRPKSNVRLDKNSFLLIALKISVPIKSTATIDIKINIKALFLNRPKAAPVFVTNVI